MNSMASFNTMSHPGHHSGLSAAGAMTPVTPTSSMPMSHVAASVPPSSVAGPCGGLQQQPARNHHVPHHHHHVPPPSHVHPSSDGYACMSRTPSAATGYDISSLSPYNRHHHGAMGPTGVTSLGHQPMGPTATSVAMANATHNYHQSVNGQYSMHHNSHNTGKIYSKPFKKTVYSQIKCTSFSFIRFDFTRSFCSGGRSRSTDWNASSILDSIAIKIATVLNI